MRRIETTPFSSWLYDYKHGLSTKLFMGQVDVFTIMRLDRYVVKVVTLDNATPRLLKHISDN